jgi:hypothetical protein
MKQVETNIITSPPRKRITGKKGMGSVSSNEETRLTLASDCDSDMNLERERGKNNRDKRRGWGLIHGMQLSWSGIP